MLQTGEIIIIAILALVIFGPERLPEMARKVGVWIAELRKAAREITSGLEAEVSELKDLGRELQGPLDEIKKPLTEIRDDMTDLGQQAYEWKGPKPVSGPTPEDAMRDYREIHGRSEDGSADSSGSTESGQTPERR
ncbi:MAG TPA: twin-arginine translocase TatA/TatE family subunit, partial [Acidimicrobiia bacterium]|nr:twin-arginine translocase TatA/TatE family subunit [Acidimicrobiia bacterium]